MHAHTHPPASDESARPITILVVGGSLPGRNGIVAALAQEAGFTVVGQVPNAAEAERLAGERRPDVVVLVGGGDPLGPAGAGVTSLPGPAGVPWITVDLTDLTDIAALVPAIRLLRSGYQVGAAHPAPGALASGAARATHAWEGFDKLTWREIEVVHLMLRGWSNAEIAEALTLSGATVKSHVHSLMGKLELKNRIDVITTAYTTGFVRPGVPRPATTGRPRLAGSPA